MENYSGEGSGVEASSTPKITNNKGLRSGKKSKGWLIWFKKNRAILSSLDFSQNLTVQYRPYLSRKLPYECLKKMVWTFEISPCNIGLNC